MLISIIGRKPRFEAGECYATAPGASAAAAVHACPIGNPGCALAGRWPNLRVKHPRNLARPTCSQQNSMFSDLRNFDPLTGYARPSTPRRVKDESEISVASGKVFWNAKLFAG